MLTFILDRYINGTLMVMGAIVVAPSIEEAIEEAGYIFQEVPKKLNQTFKLKEIK